MKKILLIVAVIATALANSLTASAETRWGVTAATNISNMKFNQDLASTSQVCNFSVGVTGELIIPGIGFAVDGSLLYSQLGSKINLGEYPVWSTDGIGSPRTYQHYLEIPLNLKFKYSNLNGIENTIAPIVFGGPTFTILMAHSDIPALKYAGGEFSAHVGMGCELIRRIQVTASYNWGLTYALRTVKLDQYSAKNRYWRVAVTYMF
ncbi:MAG: outer membrane beta-barrel protein [Muribaculaceae bacterium]